MCFTSKGKPSTTLPVVEKPPNSAARGPTSNYKNYPNPYQNYNPYDPYYPHHPPPAPPEASWQRPYQSQLFSHDKVSF